jgi:fumarate hydratase class II
MHERIERDSLGEVRVPVDKILGRADGAKPQ